MSDSRQALLDAAHHYGTPLYVYDAAVITAQYQRLTTAFANTDARFFYAAKALTNRAILQHLLSLGCSIDCSSINEVRLALGAGFRPSQILYTSNNVAFAEIKEAVSLGVAVNIDSLSNLEKFGEAYGDSYPVGIRLRPNIMAGGNLKISTGHAGSKFGIPVEQLDQLLSVVRAHGLQVRTLHIHTGSEIKDVAVFLQGVALLFQLSGHFPALEALDLGGGFKVSYEPGGEGTPIEELATQLNQALAAFEQHTRRHLQVWFEPGKFLVAEAGFLLATVTVIKPTDTICFAGVNTGLNHLIRPMFYEAYHHISNLSNPEGPLQVYQVTGNICETDDFAVNRPLPQLREEDVLAFHHAGAYGFEMASSYNARCRPAEVLLKDGKARLIRKRETLDDLLSNQLMNQE